MPSGKTPDDKAPAQAEISALTPAATTAVPTERAQFKSLLLGNPNYFGSFPKLGGIVVLPKKYDVAWEELTCLGLEPSQERLEAVVNIKQHAGYNGDACSQGSHEYVRFFVERNGAWQDLGSVAAQVYDLATTPLPLSYCVAADFNEARKFCNTENIVNVRAILSWNLEPPAGDPNFTPPFGNVLDARVQVAPLLLHEVPIAHLLAEGTLTLKPEALAAVDSAQKLASQEPQPLSYAELKTLYASANVPGHRFGFAEAQTLMQKPALGTLTPAKTATLAAGAELGAILAAIQKQSGDTSYEELLCAGFNPGTRELEAVVEIKRNAGYSGGLCSAGSTEYVRFFVYIGGAWQSLGTAAVKVHDLAAVTPGHPLMYGVYRIQGFPEAPCKDLTGVPLRAILSWQAQPTGPDYVPVWGNVVNTHIQPMIGAVEPGEHIRLMRLGDVTVNGIGSTTGLANPTGVAGDCAGDDSPFGGEVIVEGDFLPKIDVFNHTTGLVKPGTKPIVYQVWVTRTDVPSAPFQLTNAFGIALFPPDAVFPPVIFAQSVQPAPGPVPTGVPGTLYYQYMESDYQAVNPRTLAAFEAGGLTEGNYYVEVRGWYWNGSAYVPMTSQGQLIHVYNGYPHLELGSTVRRPQVAIALTSVADCGNVKVGDTITGSYSVVDNFFGYLTIALVPITVGGVPQPENAAVITPVPNTPANATAYNGANTGGSNGTFTLDTTGMTPCGYNIRLYAQDRALCDSHCYAHWNETAVGFCLSPK